jgi:hypothetical protein
MNVGPSSDRAVRRTDVHQDMPAGRRTYTRSNAMNGFLHEEIARQRHREAYLEARRIRLVRAVRAERRARRAVEVAVRAGERAGVDEPVKVVLASR